jgi:uncharacterized protein
MIGHGSSESLDRLPPEFWQAIEQFNQQAFYECHDTLEALWMEAIEPEKRFYQGILQIAVACYHLGNQNHRGAVMLLGEGTRRLLDYTSSDYGGDYGIDVTKLVEQSTLLLEALQLAALRSIELQTKLQNKDRGEEKSFADEADDIEIFSSDLESKLILMLPQIFLLEC